MSQKMILSLNPVQKRLNNVKIPDDFCGFVKITEKPAPTWVWIFAHLGIDFSQLKNHVESDRVKKEEPQVTEEEDEFEIGVTEDPAKTTAKVQRSKEFQRSLFEKTLTQPKKES